MRPLVISLFWLSLHFCMASLFPSLVMALPMPFGPPLPLRRISCSLRRQCPFSLATPYAWNYFPLHVHNVPSLSFFKSHLKMHLYRDAFSNLDLAWMWMTYLHVVHLDSAYSSCLHLPVPHCPPPVSLCWILKYKLLIVGTCLCSVILTESCIPMVLNIVTITHRLWLLLIPVIPM